MEVTIHNQASEIPLAHQALDDFATKHELRIQGVARLHVALEEHLVNVISYGYNPGQAGCIRIRFDVVPSALRVEIEDDARPFNPLEAPEVDTSLPLDAKPIGGLGVHLIRKGVDEVGYRRAGERNLLVMTKRLAESVTEEHASVPAPVPQPANERAPGALSFHWPLAAMRKEVFRKGEWLFKRGDKADRMYYLHEGAVWLPEIKKTITAGQVIGELGLFSPRSERTASAVCEQDLEAYSIGRKEVLQFFKEDASLAIELIQVSFSRLIERERNEVASRERLESELRIAREIQMSMLPHSAPPAALRGKVVIGASIEPAKEVGGDFYDYFMTGRDELCVLIGDASGKGVPAALFVAVGKSLLRAEASRGSRPHQIVSRVNRLMCPDNSLCMFITLLCLKLNTRTGEAECCSAGHERPLVCKADGTVQAVELPAGMAIGVMDNARYQSRKIRLYARETFFAYTDGVTDAVNPQQECFSHKRLVKSLAALSGSDVPQLLDGVMKDIQGYADSEPPSDDITIAAVRFLGGLSKASRARVRG